MSKEKENKKTSTQKKQAPKTAKAPTQKKQSSKVAKSQTQKKQAPKTTKATAQKKQNSKAEANPTRRQKFINAIKKKWLIKGTTTAALVAAIIATFAAITVVLQNLELTPIDLSQEQLYTLSDEVKQKIQNANIQQDVKIYFFGSTEDDSNYELAKQFTKVNEHITAETVDASANPELANKYSVESGTQEIVIECGEKSKIVLSSDLVTYDTTTGETISIADEKLANSIVSITGEKTPKVYFLDGYGEFSLSHNMMYLNSLLANEVVEVESFDMMTTGKVPDDCDTLVITTPSKDFETSTADAILSYLKSGKNVLWFNACQTEKVDLPNVNRVLAEYGVNPFDVGYIQETDTSKMAVVDNQAYPNLIKPEISGTSIATKNIYSTTGIMLLNATKINMADDTTLSNENVTKTDLITTSEGSIYSNGEQGPFTVGVEIEKTIEEEDAEHNKPAVKSKMILIGENFFITDYSISQTSQIPVVSYEYNRNLPIDAIAYLADREEDIATRKSTGTVSTLTTTQTQAVIIRTIIFTIPILIIVVGIVVWQKRRRKK